METVSSDITKALKVPAGLHSVVKDLAWQQRTTMIAVLVEAISLYVEKLQNTPNPAPAKKIEEPEAHLRTGLDAASRSDAAASIRNVEAIILGEDDE
jgi:hypothetical protein